MKNLIFADIFNKVKVFMKLSLFTALLLLGFANLSLAQTLQEGIRHLENENYSAALATFNKLAQSDPKEYIYSYYIGEVYYAMDNPAEARKSYNKGLEISSKCDQCHVGLGRLDLDENKVGDAKKHFETALKGNSKNSQLQSMVGMAYLYGKKPIPEAALEYFSKARDLDPKQSKYWIYLGDSYQAKGDLGNSMTSYETAVEKDKNDPETYVKMGRIWASGKQVDLAIEQLEKAIKIKPDYAIAYKDLYELYIRTGKYDKVVPLLEKYVSLIGSDVDAKVRFVKFLCFQAKDYKRAIEEGNKILVSNPEEYTLHRWLAWSYYESGNFKSALDESFLLFSNIQKDTANRKTYPSDYEYAARAAAKLNLMDTSEMFFVELMKKQPERNAEIEIMLAKSYYDAKNYNKAEYWYQEKAKIAPLTVGELVYLGIAQRSNGKLVMADTTFGQVLSLSPKYDYGWYIRAKINYDLDSTQKLFLAKPYYEKYIELASVDPVKNKARLIESYLYMVVYFAQTDNNEMSKSYCNLVLNLDPENESAKEYLKILTGQKEKKKSIDK